LSIRRIRSLSREFGTVLVCKSECKCVVHAFGSVKAGTRVAAGVWEAIQWCREDVVLTPTRSLV